MNTLIKVLGWSVALLVCVSVLVGCATPDASRRESDIPWNQPQPWEGSPFIPGMDRY